MERLLVFPEPFPDESLYSLVVRYHRMVANVSYRRTSQELFGTYSRTCGSVLPCCLEALSARTDGLVTVPKLLRSLTLLPLYKPFLSPSTYVFAVRHMKGADGTGLQMRLGITASGFLRYSTFRYCEACIEHDTATHGIAYWHRIHQATGVCVCPIHRGSLIAAYSPKHSAWSSLLLPGEAGGTSMQQLGDSDATAVVAVMQLWGLSNPDAVSGLLAGGFLKGRLRDMGLALDGRLKASALREFAVRRVGKCGALYEYSQATKSIGWVLDILHCRPRIVQPFRFYFLCWILGVSLEDLIGFVPQDSVAVDLNYAPVSSLPRVIPLDKIERMRRDFAADSHVRCHDKAGYHWLYRNDRAWLHAYVVSRPRQREVLRRADWSSRDEMLSQELISAKLALDKISGKPVKVTKSELLRRVTNGFGIERNPSKLPKSTKLIQEYAESEHDFQLRKLSWALGSLGPHQVCSLSVMLRNSGIRVLRVERSKVENLINSRGAS